MNFDVVDNSVLINLVATKDLMLNIILKIMSLLPQPNIVLYSKFQAGHQFFNIHVQNN
jgi:hypothetical protein